MKTSGATEETRSDVFLTLCFINDARILIVYLAGYFAFDCCSRANSDVMRPPENRGSANLGVLIFRKQDKKQTRDRDPTPQETTRSSSRQKHLISIPVQRRYSCLTLSRFVFRSPQLHC
ncbi:hypothetical protein J6590_020350 [Homalodisca vitripennis]|nr:hypothetical protein J6590_020350 [Homalodisca vitripennis]